MGGKYPIEKQRAYYRARYHAQKDTPAGDHRREKQTEYWRRRRQMDPLARLKNNVRNRINKGVHKDVPALEYLGCSWERLRQHLESQFTDGMTWDNYGDWHVDHITPLSNAITEEHARRLCHYTNLQPLWGTDNQSKGGVSAARLLG